MMATGTTALDQKIGAGPGRIGMLVFGVTLIIGLIYAGGHLLSDLSQMHSASVGPYVLLGVALLIALGFEFVNGFHDTANAVATVIYTHSLEPHIAVVWSGMWNFIGVLVSTGDVGLVGAALLLMIFKALIPNKELYAAPKGTKPPPFWIRALLVLTCTGVSFAHGSNDGQKGMGLIMLILIGTVPTAYALNHAVTTNQTQDFIAVSRQAVDALNHYVTASTIMADPREDVTDYVRTREFKPATTLALRELVGDMA